MEKTLNDMMEFWQVVYSDGNGNVEPWDGMHGPYSDSIETFDGRTIEPTNDGWEPLNGFSGQCGYSGPIMHESEYVGGGLEDHIRENEGFYVCEVVNYYPEGWEDSESVDDTIAGWAVFFKEA